MDSRLRRSLLTLGLAAALVPVHELGHMFFDWIYGIQITGFSLLSLTPFVATSQPMPPVAFLGGTLFAAAPCVILLWQYRARREVTPYVWALIISVILAGLQDYIAVYRMLS